MLARFNQTLSSVRSRKCLVFLCTTLVQLLCIQVASAVDISDTGWNGWTPVTKGGSTEGARVIPVTTLADNGKGSFRAAVNARGPRILVFEVTGLIEAEADVTIAEPHITIAGHTAPAPGITVTGATLRIRTHDVVVQHIAVRPGPAPSEIQNEDRDGINIGGTDNRGDPVRNILLENIGVSWAVDENIGIWGNLTDKIQVHRAIISDALDDAGHPKGRHSMGLITGTGVKSVSISNSVFANNVKRNPRISNNTRAIVANNVIFNPQTQAIQVHPDCNPPNDEIILEDNILIRGASTYNDVELLSFGGLQMQSEAELTKCNRKKFIHLTQSRSPVSVDTILRSAGAFPQFRSQMDVDLMREIRTRQGKIKKNVTLSQAKSAAHLASDIQPLVAARSPYAAQKISDKKLSPDGMNEMCQRFLLVTGELSLLCSGTVGETD